MYMQLECGMFRDRVRLKHTVIIFYAEFLEEIIYYGRVRYVYAYMYVCTCIPFYGWCLCTALAGTLGRLYVHVIASD